MTPTRVRTLAIIAATTFAGGWLLVVIVDKLVQRLVPVPWTAAAALALLALALLIWGLLAKPKLQRKPGRPPMDPITATRTAALALAASRTGAGVLGFYAGVALGLRPAWDTPAGRDYALASMAAAVASLGLVVVALWLESICRLRDGGDDDEAGGSSAGRPARGRATGEAARRAA